MTASSAIISFLPLLVGLPLLGALLCILIPSPRWQAGCSVAVGAMQILLVVLLILSFQATLQPFYYVLGGWHAPLGIKLVVDGLSLVLLLTTATLVLGLTVYSVWYFSAWQSAGFWPLWWLLVAGLNAAFIAADVFNIYVALEMIGLASVALVALAGTRTALTAALRYALVGLLGSLCYLLGVALLYRVYGTLDMAQLAQYAQSDAITWLALSFISVGLLLKTALLPLHFWLPPAHSSAPAPVSAALSGLVVKASFYLMICFWLEVLVPVVNATATNFLGGLGAVAIIWGCIAAIRAQRLKLLIAYSTVAQLGYLFLMFPLAFPEYSSRQMNQSAVAAGAYFIIAHALAKAAMFLSAGNIMASLQHDNINKLHGLVRCNPLALLTFAIAGVSLIGLPPSGGFIAKWLMLNVAVENGQWWWVAIMLVGGLLTAVYIGRVLNIAFSGNNLPARESVTNVPAAMTGCALVVAILAIILGFNAEWILQLLEYGTAKPGLMYEQTITNDVVAGLYTTGVKG